MSRRPADTGRASNDIVRSVRVRVLGGLAVEDVTERELGSRKARTLLKVLALARGRPVAVDRLADVLWGDDAPARPAEQVGVLVSRLRGVFGADRLPRTDAGYALVADWLDVDELAARVEESVEALGAGRLAAARVAAEAATALARGPVLPDEDGDWVEAERAAVASLVGTARRVAAEAAGRAGDHASASALAELALAHDPYDEPSLRVLMRAHAAAGRPASALAAYARVRARLAEDLGVSATAETEALHDAILLEEPVAGAFDRAAEHAAPLPGRDRELAALDAALAGVSTGTGEHGRSVVVRGEAGIGKTALLDHWTQAAGRRALVLVGRCDPLGRDLPLQPVVDALAVHLAGLTPEDRRTVLDADAAVLGPLVGVDATPDTVHATVVPDQEMGRARLFAALLAVLTRLAAGRPTVLAIDDLHLAGPSTLAWLTFATRRSPRLLVVATTRATEDPLLPEATALVLGPLDLDAAATIVGEARAAELHARSGGHPLFLHALAESDEDDLPASVREAAERRVAGLGAAATTLRAAAILGGDVDLDLLAEVLRAPAVELLEHLEQAAAAGLVVERGTGYSFRHELEREALVASAGTARRALVHRQAARALATRPAPDPLAVAVHARLGGETDLAVESYVRAAEVAANRFDLSAAEGHLDAALALQESPAALAARARVHMAANRLEEAADDAARAIEANGGARALEVAGWVAYYRRRYDEALACAEEGVDRAADAAVRVSCLALVGRVRHGAGDLDGAVARLERAVSADAPSEVRGLAAVWLAQVRAHQGRPADALAVVQGALVDPDRLTHPFAPLHGRFARVLALGQLGRVSEALSACDELDTAVERAGAAGTRLVGPAANCRAWLLRWTGWGEEADELNRAAVERSDATGPRAEAYYAGLLDLADGRVLAGDLDAAAALGDRLAPIADWDGTMAWHQRHRWGLLRARLALAAGDRDAAAELAASVAGDAATRGARRYELLALAIGALIQGRRGTDPAALDAVVDGLGECASIDGWPLVAAMGAVFEAPRWRDLAEQRAAAVVRDAPDPEAARALADRLLG